MLHQDIRIPKYKVLVVWIGHMDMEINISPKRSLLR